MASNANVELSILIPAHNEAESLPGLIVSLQVQLRSSKIKNYEIIVCDDGSSDNTSDVVLKCRKTDKRVKLLKMARNFGKENALTALIAAASGEAMISLDADGQHPVDYIPKFISAWKKGAQMVVGIRVSNSGEGSVKRLGSRWFYKLFNNSTGEYLVPGSTDFRLITREVANAFLKLSESDRITRGLLDWLGYEPVYIKFRARARERGSSTYTKRKLLKLATDSFVSLSPKPLYMFGLLGVIITMASGLLGLVVLVEEVFFGDPLNWNFTGTACLGILIVFLVGILLMSQGLLSLYVTSIQRQSKNRPLYVINYSKSAGIDR